MALAGRLAPLVWRDESAELHAGQSRGLTQTLAQVDRELTQITDTLARGRARRTRTQLEAAIDKIVNKQYVREIATYTLTGDTPPPPG